MSVATDADHPLPKALRRPWRSARGATRGRPGHGRGRSAGPGEERRPTNRHGCAPWAASRNDYWRIPHHRQSTARPAGQPALVHCLRQHLPTRGVARLGRRRLLQRGPGHRGPRCAPPRRIRPAAAPPPRPPGRPSPTTPRAPRRRPAPRKNDVRTRNHARAHDTRRVHGHPGDGRPTVVRSDRRGLGSAGRVVARPLRTLGCSTRRSPSCPVPLRLPIFGAVGGPIGWPRPLCV